MISSDVLFQIKYLFIPADIWQILLTSHWIEKFIFYVYALLKLNNINQGHQINRTRVEKKSTFLRAC